jgi:acyl-CoA synthetase (AMP-forming)/AMP-acid ligase II/thioesterase domain-containing protein/acyl carrier protein
MKPAVSLGETAAPSPYSSLAEAILSGVERFPDGGFLYFGRNGQTQECSYRETLDQARRLVAGLRRKGARAGDALLIGLTEARDVVPALWAAAMAGCVAIPSVQSTNADKASIPDAEKLAFLNGVFGKVRVLAERTAATGDPDDVALDFEGLVATAATSDPKLAMADPEEPRFGILTSGTTGRPRLVGLSDRAALARWWPKLPDAAHARGFLSWSSFGHVMGLGLAMPNLPMKVHLDAARFVANPISWLEALESTGATHATMTNFGMSLILQAVAENPGRRWRLERVRKIGVGAEAISRETCGRFLACLTEFGLREDALILGYGLSECGPVVGGGIPFSADDPDDTDTPPQLDRPTSGHAVRIVDEAGRLLREGESGRIEVCGPTMTTGYLGDDEATAALFTPDRWLRTGDLGFLRDGKLTVAGREKELVIVNARKYTCQDIEIAVKSRTSLSEIYAAPLEDSAAPDTAGAGAPCAVFVVVDRPDAVALKPIADAVRAAVAEAFRFTPKVVALVSHDEVPRTAMQKIRRLAMPALLAEPGIASRASHLGAGSPTVSPNSGNTEIEARIARIWSELLRSEGEVDRDADFFALGGDSLLALRMSFLLEEEFGVPVRIERLAAKLSIAELARFLSGPSSRSGTGAVSPSSDAGLPDWFIDRLRGFLESWPGTPALPDGLVRRVGTGRKGIPVFWCMQHPEEAFAFEQAMGGRFPSYAMRSGMFLLEYDTPLAEALAGRYVEEIKRICREGPLIAAGTCQGANIALAVARSLVAEGREVRLLAAADCRLPELCGASPVPVPVALFAAVRSKFNPYRYFRHPEIGLRKLAPRGLRVEMIDTTHAKIMQAPAMEDLANGVEAAIGWAGSRNPALDDPSAPRPALIHEYRISSPFKTLELRAGERLSLPAKLKNTSPIAWEAFDRSGLALGNHWLLRNGSMLVWSDGRTALKRRLGPGERAYMTLDVVAPHEPGDYLLEVDLVEEGIRWFADFALAPLHIPVHVRPFEGEDDRRPGRSRHSFVLPAVFGLADRLPLLTGARRERK